MSGWQVCSKYQFFDFHSLLFNFYFLNYLTLDRFHFNWVNYKAFARKFVRPKKKDDYLLNFAVEMS